MIFRPRPASECERSRSAFSQYIDRRLQPAERRSLERHVEHCAACAQELAGLRQTVTALQSLPRVAVPRSFVLSVPSAVPPRVSPWYFYFRNAAGAVAALLVLTLGLSYWSALPQGSSAPFSAAKHGEPAADSVRGVAPAAARRSDEVPRAPAAGAPAAAPFAAEAPVSQATALASDASAKPAAAAAQAPALGAQAAAAPQPAAAAPQPGAATTAAPPGPAAPLVEPTAPPSSLPSDRAGTESRAEKSSSPGGDYAVPSPAATLAVEPTAAEQERPSSWLATAQVALLGILVALSAAALFVRLQTKRLRGRV